MAKAYVEIPLTKGKVALVDVEDAERVKARRWRTSASAGKMGTGPYYALTGSSGDDRFYMHQMVTGAKYVDHINGNTLDNRRENLRVATPKENSANRGNMPSGKSGYKGVSYRPRTGKFEAQVYRIGASTTKAGRRLYSATFDTAEDAARAWDAAVRRLRPGDFNRFNFPNIGERGLDGEIRTI